MDSLILSQQNPSVITRDEARALGKQFYFTGKACHKGHIAERYVITANCVACVRKPAKPKVVKLCSVDGCGKRSDAKGFCPKHYNMWKVHGDPLHKPKWDFGAGVRWIEEHVNYAGDECLIWPFGSCGERQGGKGYGQSYYEGEKVAAHILMCIKAHGPKPTPEHMATHKCGNGHHGCTAPNHLKWGTAAENTDDKFRHGNQGFGERSANARLSDSDINEIRALEGRLTQRKIASMYGVTRNTIGRIFRGECWWYIAKN